MDVAFVDAKPTRINFEVLLETMKERGTEMLLVLLVHKTLVVENCVQHATEQ